MVSHDTADKIKKAIEKWKIDPTVFGGITFLLLLLLALSIDPLVVSSTLVCVILISPIWLPISLFSSFWRTWMHYIRFDFWFKIEYVLLQIELPAEVQKSPLAMELFLTALHNTGGETTFIARLWKGSFRPIYSLEIASNEGRIHYYIRLGKFWRNVIEARLYGQFPEAKVTEVEDYTKAINFNLEEYDIWGAEFKKNAPDAVPIKTYVDYNLDKNDDEEYKIDPITNILELLGNIGPGEYFWMQIILKARKKDEWYGFYKAGDVYKDGGKAAIQEVMVGAALRAQAVLHDSEIVEGKVNSLLTDGEKRKIEAIEKAMSKPTFECGFRVVYLAKKERFNTVNIPSIVYFFSAFRSLEFNGVGFVGRGIGVFDYPWQDFHDIRRTKMKKQLWFWYKHRAYFYVPYDQDPTFLNVEELATLWHFPSSIVKTPALQRVASKRSEAPSDLPVLPS